MFTRRAQGKQGLSFGSHAQGKQRGFGLDHGELHCGLFVVQTVSGGGFECQAELDNSLRTRSSTSNDWS